MKVLRIFFISMVTLLISCGESKVKVDLTPSISIGLQEIASGLSSPVAAAFTPEGLMLVCEQTGQIIAIENNKLRDIPFLDLTSKLVKLSGAYDERGLLGIALHPDFTNNNKLYVYYSAPAAVKGSDHQSIISEFKVSSDPFLADPGSERVLLTVEQPESNHNGGDLKFGPDGYLYIGLGDGGGAGDKHGQSGNGQDLNTLLGKILRIDVNTSENYGIPQDNPFVGQPQVRPEIWAYGLRNPWRFSFDRKTGQLFAADVGQNKFEEVNIIEKGGNYGWRTMEGFHCFNPDRDCDTNDLKLPIAEYAHEEGISITGGFVYHGEEISAIADKYIFGDWTGPMFYLAKNGESWTRGPIEWTNKPSETLKVLGFAEDNQAELYVLTNQDSGPKSNKGAVYKLVKP